MLAIHVLSNSRAYLHLVSMQPISLAFYRQIMVTFIKPTMPLKRACLFAIFMHVICLPIVECDILNTSYTALVNCVFILQKNLIIRLYYS